MCYDAILKMLAVELNPPTSDTRKKRWLLQMQQPRLKLRSWRKIKRIYIVARSATAEETLRLSRMEDEKINDSRSYFAKDWDKVGAAWGDGNFEIKQRRFFTNVNSTFIRNKKGHFLNFLVFFVEERNSVLCWKSDSEPAGGGFKKKIS